MILLPTLFGIIAIILGQDNSWDLRNYHFYNPYAFANGRFHTDIQVAQLQTYLNPTLDFLFFSLIENYSPRIATFLMAFIQGINGTLVIVLFLILFQKIKPITRLVYIIGLTILATYAPLMISLIGTSSNDLTPSILILCALIITARCLQKETIIPNKYIFLSGLLVGASIGLKLTQAPHAIAYAGAILFLPGSISKRLKKMGVAVISLFFGVIITSGWWMIYLWSNYDNPFFPFYNDIFHSSLILEKNWSDNRYLPQSLFEHLCLPFKWLYKSQSSEKQYFYQDSRYAIIYIISIIWLIKNLYAQFQKIVYKKQSKNQILSLEHLFIIIFFFISYIVWQLKFSILRYTHVLEMLAPSIILIVVLHLINNNKLRWITLLLFSTIILVQFKPPNIERLPFGETFFRVQFPKLEEPENTMLLIAGEKPWGYLVASIPDEIQIVRLTSNIIKKDHQGIGMKEKIIKTIREHTGPIYLLTNEFFGKPKRSTIDNSIVELGTHYQDLRSYNLDINIEMEVDKTRPNALRVHSEHEPPGLIIVEVIKSTTISY